MASPRTRNQELRDRERNERLADWIAREKLTYLNAVARRSGAPDWQIADVVQSALTNFFRAYPGPDVPEAALAYCARCVATESWKARRRHARKEGHETPVPERERNDRLGTGEELGLVDPDWLDPLDTVIEHERIEALRQRLAELPDDQRTVVALAAAGYSPAEIAELRGLSVRQVRKRIEKGNRRLRDQ